MSSTRGIYSNGWAPTGKNESNRGEQLFLTIVCDYASQVSGKYRTQQSKEEIFNQSIYDINKQGYKPEEIAKFNELKNAFLKGTLDLGGNQINCTPGERKVTMGGKRKTRKTRGKKRKQTRRRR